jgi:hypothetical protein
MPVLTPAQRAVTATLTCIAAGISGLRAGAELKRSGFPRKWCWRRGDPFVVSGDRRGACFLCPRSVPTSARPLSPSSPPRARSSPPQRTPSLPRGMSFAAEVLASESASSASAHLTDAAHGSPPASRTPAAPSAARPRPMRVCLAPSRQRESRSVHSPGDEACERLLRCGGIGSVYGVRQRRSAPWGPGQGLGRRGAHAGLRLVRGWVAGERDGQAPVLRQRVPVAGVPAGTQIGSGPGARADAGGSGGQRRHPRRSVGLPRMRRDPLRR